MSATGPMKREPDETPVEVYELSSSDGKGQTEQLGKRGSASGSPWDDDHLQKRQRLQDSSVDDLQDFNASDDAIRDLNIDLQDLNASDDAVRDWNIDLQDLNASDDAVRDWNINLQDLNASDDAMRDLNSEVAGDPSSPIAPLPFPPQPPAEESESALERNRKQFWKAGDYEGQTKESKPSVGIEHCRVHPRFLHANATCHKWALGAIAELVDNAIDEVANGATFVSLDVCSHPSNHSAMLIVEDDGGGMNPNKLRQCMSLGYSIKSKRAEAIGQYGNGFKTSTMRLAADVIVFSRSPASGSSPATLSICMLSFTFLRETGHDDVVVPMIDYEFTEDGRWIKRSALERWAHNLETMQTWSPYVTEEELLDQFVGMKDHGTKIVLHNLWEDDQGQLELDFNTNPSDVQTRGPNRDKKRLAMVQRFPNSRHYLTYGHSLRSYLSILYLRRPPGFKIILRREEVRHHNVVDDLMYTKEHTYRPQSGPVLHGTTEIYMEANVILGFVKDAKDHVNIHGFNVYHKNRLIKPFWQVWNSNASRGRGIIGVLEANFVVPAHDKQGFERSPMASRLESRLIQMQKAYWANNCCRIGYVGSMNTRPSFLSTSFPAESVPDRGQASTMATPYTEPNDELRLSLHSDSLSNGTPIATQGAGNSSQQGAPSPNSLADLGRTLVVQSATRLTGSDVPQHVQQQPSPSNVQGTSVMAQAEFLRHLKEDNARILEKCRKLEEAREQKLVLQVEQNRKLQSKILDIEQKRAALRRNIELCTREQDAMNTAMEEERMLRKREQEETRQKLAELGLGELEAENQRLRLLCSERSSNPQL